MTILAQLHDCHSCYDERSIDQKKKTLRLVSWVSCEVPARVQQVLHQLMTLFGKVAPVFK